MSRYCLVCHRARKACICSFIQKVTTHVELIILQHPTEVMQAKGSAAILSLSLPNSKCFIGEDFTHHQELNALLEEDQINTFLLYPSDKASILNEQEGEILCREKRLRIILIDGTWRKAYKMIQCSRNLHHLPTLSLPAQSISGRYQIRKAAQHHQLSTLEAGYELLCRLDPDNDFSPLLTAFQRMIEQYLSYIPSAVREKNYPGSDEKTLEMSRK